MLESHPLPPFLPPNARILMLGSFPPPRSRWKMDFYYPNFQNDMWRIFGIVFFGDPDHFIDREKKVYREILLREFLMNHGIALSDTARIVRREKWNASDAHLEVVESIDLPETLLEIPHCHTLVTTGELATRTLFSLFGTVTPPAIGASAEVSFAGRKLTCFRMPSTSRAYPKPLIEKAEIYKRVFRGLDGFIVH